MCQINKSLNVTLSVNDIASCINDMQEEMTPAERHQLLESIHPGHADIIQLLLDDVNTASNNRNFCWNDSELCQILQILFNHRHLMSKGQMIAAINDVVING